jgi:adenylate cyclase
VPFAQGRELATQLPQARFVPFEGQSSAAWAWSSVLVPEIRRFLELEAVAGPEAPAAAVHTILFTDIEGSTTLTQRLGDAEAQALLRTHNTIVRDALKGHDGSEVKHTGDGIMASFASAARSLECAIAMQRAFATSNESSGEPVRVRIGLNAGEPVAEEEDLFGTAVQAAARICAEAGPGQIVASDVVRQLVAGKGFLFADRGEVALRGFDDSVRLYEVGWREEG